MGAADAGQGGVEPSAENVRPGANGLQMSKTLRLIALAFIRPHLALARWKVLVSRLLVRWWWLTKEQWRLGSLLGSWRTYRVYQGAFGRSVRWPSRGFHSSYWQCRVVARGVAAAGRALARLLSFRGRLRVASRATFGERRLR